MHLLHIEEMDLRHPGLTPAVAAYFHEAASVCLQRHHASPTEVDISVDESTLRASVAWPAPSARCLASHANEDDATRDGAYACVLAAVELAGGLVAIARAETKTGADYYLVPVGADVSDLEQAIRLEVSGLNSGEPHDVARRLRQKVEQARNGRSPLPALAGVVGFRAGLILLKKAV